MADVPPFVEKFLALLGLSTTQIKWRYLRMKDRVQTRAKILAQPKARHKFCRRCGLLATAEASTCPQCLARLPSYLGSKVYRAMAFTHLNAVSLVFLGLLSLVFCIMLGLTEFRALLTPTGEDLAVFGAFSTQLAQEGAGWRVLTMGLLHIGILHLVFNLGALSQTLPAFEEEIGGWPTLVLLTLTQVGAVGMHVLVHHPATLTAGASGMAFGVIGFGVAYFHRLRRVEPRNFFLKWCAYGLIFGLLMRANNSAHMGGLLTGLPLGFLAAGMRIRDRWIWRWTGILCLGAWLFCLGFLVSHVLQHREALRQEGIAHLLPEPGRGEPSGLG